MAGNPRGRLLRLAAGQPEWPEAPDALSALAQAAVAGDRAAVHTFLVRVGPHLLRVVRHALGANHPDVEAVTLESAFAVMDALPRDRGESTVLQLVCGVAALTATNVRRREAARKRHAQGEQDLETEQAPDSASPSDEAALAFDGDAPALAGDEERIERIAWRVQKSRPRIRLSPRAGQAAQSVALAVLIASVVIAGIKLSRWHPRSRVASAQAAPSARNAQRARPSLEHDQQLVPVEPENEPTEAPPNKTAVVPLRSDAAAAIAGSGPPKYKSASDLFAEANQARVSGDARGAIATSQLLEATFPNSTEGITTHLSLGVLYLQQGEPALALQELKMYRHIGSSALMAEALWGEEQALQQLGRTVEERAVLEELLQNYPRSVYAAAAEKRLAALNN